MLSRGFLGSLLVLAGGLVVSTLPYTTPLMRLSMLEDVRGSTAGRMVGLAVVMLGLGLLGAAWLSLCRAVARDASPSATALVRRACLLWTLPLLAAPPLFSRDGWSYAAQGAMTHHGISPYVHGPSVLEGSIVEGVDPRWMDTITPYGPLPLAIGDVAAGLTDGPWLMVIMHRLAALAGLAMLLWAVPRMAAWAGVNGSLAAAVACASPLMMTNGVGGLHNDLLMVGLMAAALVLAVERGWVLASVLGGLAAAVKAPGGLVCVAVALVGLPAAAGMAARLRRLAGVALVGLGTLAGLGLAWGVGLGWVRGLAVPATVNTPLSLPTLLGGLLDAVAGLVGLDTPPAAFLDLVRLAASAAALGVVAWLALRAPTGDRRGAVALVATMMGVLVLLSPVVHLWYFLWVVPFLAAMRLPRLGSVGVLAVSLIAGVVAPLDSSLHGAYLAIVMGSMIAAGVTCVLLLTQPSRARIERIVASHWWRGEASAEGRHQSAQQVGQ